MNAPPVSVVVVSRGRPQALLRCLTGLAQLQYDRFEIVVVADPDGVHAAQAWPDADHIKIVPFDRANVSEARNLGISHAAGTFVAFIDDDAVPEPTWLRHLMIPSDRPYVAAMGGYVIGRNGISFQWKGQVLRPDGMTEPIELSERRATILRPRQDMATKTEGTNMAVRREVLIELDGFDPGFAFFLDETDLNLRLAAAGHATALVPMAQVHHGFAASARRRSDRVPRDLFDIGASWAVFQRKHVSERTRPDHWRARRDAQRIRMLTLLRDGFLSPETVRHLLRRLDQGYGQGLARRRGGAVLSRMPESPFKRFPSAERSSTVIAGRTWKRSQLAASARKRVAAGDIVTVFRLSPTALFHQVRFHPDGYWEQWGGLFGKSLRTDPIFQLRSFSGRVSRETARVALVRGIKLLS